MAARRYNTPTNPRVGMKRAKSLADTLREGALSLLSYAKGANGATVRVAASPPAVQPLPRVITASPRPTPRSSKPSPAPEFLPSRGPIGFSLGPSPSPKDPLTRVTSVPDPNFWDPVPARNRRLLKDPLTQVVAATRVATVPVPKSISKGVSSVGAVPPIGNPRPPMTTVVDLFREACDVCDVYIGPAGSSVPEGMPGTDGRFRNPCIALETCRECGDTHPDYEDTLLCFQWYFRNRIETDEAFRKDVESLRGKRLGCDCGNADHECHGDTYIDYLYNEVDSNALTSSIAIQALAADVEMATETSDWPWQEEVLK